MTPPPLFGEWPGLRKMIYMDFNSAVTRNLMSTFLSRPLHIQECVQNAGKPHEIRELSGIVDGNYSLNNLVMAFCCQKEVVG